MTRTDPTPPVPRNDARVLGWLTATTGLLSVISAVVLALTGHTEAAVAVGFAGGAVAGGTQVTVNIRR